jgi:CRP/FNR family transcriptional regulator, cyclic AMP receptor protein
MTRTSELSAGLNEPQCARLFSLASPVTLQPGATLFRLGADAANLYVIERGQIALTMPMQIAGHEEEVTVGERVAGQTVGWSTLIPPHRFTLTATASVETQLLAFPRETLLEFCAATPDLGYVISQNVAAIVGQRLQVFQAMWLRQMQRMVNLTHA